MAIKAKNVTDFALYTPINSTQRFLARYELMKLIQNIPGAVKSMLRRLEFYFKWLSLNDAGIRSDGNFKELVSMKEVMMRECEQFSSETKFISENLNKLRQLQAQSSGVLIEEI